MSQCLAYSPRFTNDDSFVGVYQLVATPQIVPPDGNLHAVILSAVRQPVMPFAAGTGRS